MNLAAFLEPCCDDCAESGGGLAGLGVTTTTATDLAYDAALPAPVPTCTGGFDSNGNCIAMSCPDGYTLEEDQDCDPYGDCMPVYSCVPIPGYSGIPYTSFLYGSEWGEAAWQVLLDAGLTDAEINATASSPGVAHAGSLWTNYADYYNAVLNAAASMYGIDVSQYLIASGTPLYEEGAEDAEAYSSAFYAEKNSGDSIFQAIEQLAIVAGPVVAIVAAPAIAASISSLIGTGTAAAVATTADASIDIATATEAASLGADTATIEAIGTGQAVSAAVTAGATVGQVAAAMQTAPIQTADITSDIATVAPQTVLPSTASVDLSEEDLITGVGEQASVSTPASIADAAAASDTTTAGQIAQAMQSIPTPPSSALTGPVNPSSIDAATINQISGGLTPEDQALEDEITGTGAQASVSTPSSVAAASSGVGATVLPSTTEVASSGSSLTDVLSSGKAVAGAVSAAGTIGSALAKVLGIGKPAVANTGTAAQTSGLSLPLLLLGGGLLLVVMMER